MKPIDPEKFHELKELLQTEETFPLKYMFKFIVPTGKLSEILSLFPEEKNLSTKPSSKGSYISVTVIRLMKNADEIIKVYESVSVIEGVLSL
ncbi:MAG: DUF493 family protein [Bacteriovoracaceae bacterium]|nr:DUF493 family protein [Bacteriovoracaceae bacterium]